MKKYAKNIGLVLLTIVFTLTIVIASPDVQRVVAYLNGELKINVNGELFQPKDETGAEIKPIVYGNRTYLPVRAVAELVGMKVDYDRTSNTIKLTSDLSGAIPYNDAQNLPPTAVTPPPAQPNTPPPAVIPGNNQDGTGDDAVPELQGKASEGKILLVWKPIKDASLLGYRVVVSKNNEEPKYPDDGFMYWIVDKGRSYAVVDNHEPYKNGDFGERLTPGEEYYFSITAVYKDANVTSNVVKLKYPENGSLGGQTGAGNGNTQTPYRVPVLNSRIDGKMIVLSWTPINDSRFTGYKVVISKDNPNPKYPDDGYLYYITDKAQSYCAIDNHEPYKDGDFGEYLTPGESYYFSVTALYGDLKVPSNVLKIEYPRTKE